MNVSREGDSRGGPRGGKGGKGGQYSRYHDRDDRGQSRYDRGGGSNRYGMDERDYDDDDEESESEASDSGGLPPYLPFRPEKSPEVVNLTKKIDKVSNEAVGK